MQPSTLTVGMPLETPSSLPPSCRAALPSTTSTPSWRKRSAPPAYSRDARRALPRVGQAHHHQLQNSIVVPALHQLHGPADVAPASTATWHSPMPSSRPPRPHALARRPSLQLARERLDPASSTLSASAKTPCQPSVLAVETSSAPTKASTSTGEPLDVPSQSVSRRWRLHQRSLLRPRPPSSLEDLQRSLQHPAGLRATSSGPQRNPFRATSLAQDVFQKNISRPAPSSPHSCPWAPEAATTSTAHRELFDSVTKQDDNYAPGWSGLRHHRPLSTHATASAARCTSSKLVTRLRQSPSS